MLFSTFYVLIILLLITGDCNDYSLEEVKKIREKECPIKKYELSVIRTRSFLEDNFTLIIACLILAVVALFFFTLSLILFLKQRYSYLYV